MPELAELRLTADYINQESNDRIFTKIKKNPVHKGADIFEDINFPFVLSAESRGKELMLKNISNSNESEWEQSILFNDGYGNGWSF